MLVGGGVEEDNGENIQVPHAVDPRENSAVDLEGVVPAVPVTFADLVEGSFGERTFGTLSRAAVKGFMLIVDTHLIQDEEDDSGGCTS